VVTSTILRYIVGAVVAIAIIWDAVVFLRDWLAEPVKYDDEP
jgi:hypothetical protein